MHTGSHVTRQKLLIVILGIMWIVLAVQLSLIQLVKHEDYLKKALKQRVGKYAIRARRGTLTDRNGVAMAVSRVSASYGVSPSQIETRNESARLLAEATGKSYEDVSSILSSDKPFLWLVRQAEPEVMKKLDALKIKGVHKQPAFNRAYPLGKVGAQIIGITDVDGFGIEGSELYFNDSLMGRDGLSTVLWDAKGRAFPTFDDPIIEPQYGLDIMLTIDWRIQEIAERELEGCLERTNARWCGAIVLDAETGEILAMANVPRFYPNESGPMSKTPEYMRNRLVTDMFEPGSIFKIVAFSEMLETGLLSEDDIIDCENGKYKIANHVIDDAHKLGLVPVRDVLIHSSNIGTVKIAEKIGEKRLYEQARLLGFGEVTGIDFPYETPGRFPNPRKWSKLSLPTISFGQGVAVSPLQIIMAYGAVANGGELMAPRIVKEIQGSRERSGRTFGSQVIRRTMSEDTARRLTDLLVGVVEKGTGTNAALSHVRIAGKTGTAQRIAEGMKGYVPGQYISSFVGFLTDCRTKIVCLVMVDNPRGVYYGSQVAAPVFRNIINQTLNLGDRSWETMVAEFDTSETVKTIEVPDLRGHPVREVIEQLRMSGLDAEVFGDSTIVKHQIPLGGARLNIGSVVTLYTDSYSTDRTGQIKVPDLIGKAMREAVQNLVQVNLQVTVTGSGIVTAQNPLPGTSVTQGTVCAISCSRQ